MHNIKYYKKLWAAKTSGELNPKWSYEDDCKELEQFLDNKKYDCLELGCGNGELYAVAMKHYNSYCGVDFSKSNIEKKKKKKFGIELHCADVVDFIPEKKASLIHSNQLLQYLTKSQIKSLIKSNIENCSDNGIIIHRQIPDRRLRRLYFLGYLKPNVNYIKLNQLIFPISYNLYTFFKKITFSYSDFGFWYNTNEILEICDELGVKGEIFGSSLYRYRFNLLIRT